MARGSQTHAVALVVVALIAYQAVIVIAQALIIVASVALFIAVLPHLLAAAALVLRIIGRIISTLWQAQGRLRKTPRQRKPESALSQRPVARIPRYAKAPPPTDRR